MNQMKTSDFYFDLPKELIAQTPLEPRDHSQLMVLNRATGQSAHRHFYDLIDFLEPGDLLVVNDSRVIPARLYGIKEGSGAAIELLLLAQKDNDCWETLVKPGKKCRLGAQFIFQDILKAAVIEVKEDGNRIVHFTYDKEKYKSIYEVLDVIGQMPLPPYIKEKLTDKERYQTVYSREVGSAAAPTAGLHFTPELLARIEQKGVRIARVTLHVGLGTFRPVKAENIADHHMHAEHYELPQETADLILQTKAAGKRVIAVGTTSCRTLESAAAYYDTLHGCSGYTDIFLYPGKEFHVIDGLITNFHLPESTLIMLVSAFAGYEHTMAAYREAVQKRYRFFSFGDAMLII